MIKEFCSGQIVKVTPVEEIITANETRGVLKVSGSCKKAINQTVKRIIDDFNEEGTEAFIIDPKTQGSSRSFGFSKWNCPWEPTGPKPNWAAPENPSKN